MNSPRLQIIRGMPGSGKTTLAIAKYPSLMRLETDMCFTRGAEYIFSKVRNRSAVKWFNCLFFNCCHEKMDFVVTGVFAAHTESLELCIDSARMFGYEVYIKTLSPKFKNIHNVASKDYEAMKETFVPEKQLRDLYKNDKHIHFGLMPSKIKIRKPQCQAGKTTETKCHCKDFKENKKIGEPCLCNIHVKQKK